MPTNAFTIRELQPNDLSNSAPRFRHSFPRFWAIIMCANLISIIRATAPSWAKSCSQAARFHWRCFWRSPCGRILASRPLYLRLRRGARWALVLASRIQCFFSALSSAPRRSRVGVAPARRAGDVNQFFGNLAARSPNLLNAFLRMPTPETLGTLRI